MTNKSVTTHIDCISDVISSLVNVHELIWNSVDNELDKALCYLVLLRVSQINQCDYCIEMHSKEARECGESNERLDHLMVFKHSKYFSTKEKLALEWAEVLTSLTPNASYSALRDDLQKEFSIKNIGLLTSIIGLINLWNRLRVSTH